MTELERGSLTAALERACRNGVQVVCEGIRRDTGEKVWFVSSSADPDRLHIVWLAEANHLGCSCAAYHWHPETPCAHRAACHEYLLQQDSAWRAAPQSDSQRNPATAPLRRSNQPFSMMK